MPIKMQDHDQSQHNAAIKVLMALIKQGHVLHGVSCLALVVGLLGTVLSSVLQVNALVLILFLVSILLGFLQIYYHIRVQFDRELLALIVTGELNWATLDMGLMHLGLITSDNKDNRREAQDRLSGVMALFRRQKQWLLVQYLVLLLAVLLPLFFG